MNKAGFRFNITRMIRLSRIWISDDWRPFLLMGLVIGGLVFMSGLVMNRPAVGFLFVIMLMAGTVLVSRLFAGIHKKEKGLYLYMLPASVEEKFLVQLLASLIGFFLYAVLATAAGATLFNLLGSVIADSQSFVFAYPMELWESFQTYFFFHAVFFTGALIFKRNNFLKTVLCLMGVALFVSIFFFSYLKNTVVVSGQSQFYLQFNGIDEFNRFMGGPSFTMIYYLKVSLFIIVPLLLYGISYYKYKNAQVKG